MKQSIIISIVSLFFGIIIGVGFTAAVDTNRLNEKEERLLNEGRNSIIELNKEMNRIGEKLFIIAYSEDNPYAKYSLKVLELLTPKVMNVNKSLGLECQEYKNGAPVTIEDENGIKKPVETLPEVIRISR